MSLFKESEWEIIFEETIKYLRDLIRFKTVNPPGNEKPCAEYLAEILSSNGIEPKLLESAPGRGNVIVRLTGTGEKPPLLLDGHLDVVSAEPESCWKYPPFSAEVQEGYIWGRGALDMKQAVTANLMAVLTVKRLGIKAKRDLIFSAVADEEAGGEFGAKWLVNNHPDLVKAEYALGEIGGFSMETAGKRFYPIEVAEKGVCWFRVKAKGEPGHGSIPAPESAVIKLSRAIAELGKNQLPYHLTPAVEEFLKALSSKIGGVQGMVLKLLLRPGLADFIITKVLPDKKLAKSFWAMLHNTVNPTVVRAGEKTNIVPATAEAEVDGRLLPGQTPEDLLSEVGEIIGGGYELSVFKHLFPASQDPKDPILKIFEKHLKNYDPEAIILPNLIPGFTNGSFYSRLGIKYFGFTPLRLKPNESFQELFHGFNERVEIEGYKFGLKVFIETVLELITDF